MLKRTLNMRQSSPGVHIVIAKCHIFKHIMPFFYDDMMPFENEPLMAKQKKIPTHSVLVKEFYFSGMYFQWL